MKKLTITCALLACVTAVSFAQTKATKPTTATAPGTASQASAYPELTIDKPSKEPAKTAEKAARASQKQYALTEEQYKGVYDAELYYAKQMYQLTSNGLQPGDGQALQMRMARDHGYKKALTADQYGKYAADQAKQ